MKEARLAISSWALKSCSQGGETRAIIPLENDRFVANCQLPINQITTSALTRHFEQTYCGRRHLSRDWNGISMIPQHRVTLHVTSDASGSWGCGAFCDAHWFQLPWPSSWAETTIMTKELSPIVLASMLWGHQCQGKRVQFNCDNMAVV